MARWSPAPSMAAAEPAAAQARAAPRPEMTMGAEEDYNQAFQSFARRVNLPAELSSEEWTSVPREIRERSFFMARVTDAEILQRFRDGVEDVIAGRKGTVEVEKELSYFLRDRGYQPDPNEVGTLKDLSSVKRIMVVLNTNRDMARGHAQWVRAQLRLKTYPARELIRVSNRKEPRDWEEIWRTAREKLKDIPGVHPTRMIALVNHPIWEEISDFHQPYPPFKFGSGMGTRPVPIEEARELGLVPPKGEPVPESVKEQLEPKHRSLNEGLEATPDVQDTVLKDALAERLGRFGEWDGEKMIFTDPDGSRRHTAEKLASIWAKPAPEGYDTLTQKDALDAWDGGATPDEAQARVDLRRLFDRIDTPARPLEVFRSFELDAEQAVSLIRGLAAKRLSVPVSVAGWDWSEKIALGPVKEGAWRVVLQVSDAKGVIDISALRPGKPGFVYVAGTEFRVTHFLQDVRTRLITISLELR